MLIRKGYVSNSSSCSHLVPFDPSSKGISGISSIKLPKEIWKAIERNHIEWDGTKFDMSSSDEWWLTELVSDCADQHSELADMPNVIQYLDGDRMPYGCYDENGERNYIKFSRYGQDYWVLLSDFIDEGGGDEIPDTVKLRSKARRIFDSKLNKTQKLNALMNIFDF